MKSMNTFRRELRATLSPAEARLLSKLSSPQKIQDFLDSFPVNFGRIGEAIQSPRRVIENRKAHCIEAAILAAASLAYHGEEPWLLDIQAADTDEDHVVALFKQDNLWGAISKTNHPVLRWRDPVYISVRELAMSYFHEYYLWDSEHYGKKVSARDKGKKTMRAYSRPFNLRGYNPSAWWGTKNIDWLAEALDASPHSPAYRAVSQKKLRKASTLEIQAAKLKEWKER